MEKEKKGILLAAGAYLLWGIFPLYWKMLSAIPASEILCHRVIWSLVLTIFILLLKNQWRWTGKVFLSPKVLFTFTIAAALLAVNWLTYIWAVNSNFIVEASLGYFMNPLVNVFMGVVILKERLRIGQWVSIVIAAIGVLYLTFLYGQFPWIGLILAFSFGIYGLLRKTASLESLEGFSLEMLLLFFPASGYLIYLHQSGQLSIEVVTFPSLLLFISMGIVTAVPLLLFAAGARRIMLTTLGLLQYIAPTLQFIIGVFIYGEQFSLNRFVGFSFIWLSLLLYTGDSWHNSHRKFSVAVKAL